MRREIKLSIMAVFCLLLFMFPSKDAFASVRQVGLAKDSITVEWDPISNIQSNYSIHLGVWNSEVSKTEWTKIAEVPSTQNSYTVTGLTQGNEYDIKITYVYMSSYGYTDTESYVGSVYSAKTLPGKVKNVKCITFLQYVKSVYVEYDKIESCSGYQYTIKNSSGKKVHSGDLGTYSSQLNFSIKNSEEVYTVKIRSYLDYDGQRYYGEWSDACYCIKQATLTKAKMAKKKVSIKWKKVKGATGYDIYMSTKKNKGYKKVKSVSAKTTSATISKLAKKKLSSKKKYYVYVVSKKKVGKKTYKSPVDYYYNVTK